MKDIYEMILRTLQERPAGETKTVKIPQSTYFLPHSLALKGLSDVVIDCCGSTFIFTNAEDSGIEFYQSERVTLCNLKIDYDPLPYTQGKVVGMAQDGSWYDVRIDKGYRRDPDFFIRDLGGDLNFHIFDPVTRDIKRDSDTLSPSDVAFIEEDLLRFWLQDPKPDWINLQIGDLVASSGSWCGVAVRLLHCAYMTVRDVTIYTSGGAAIMERFGYGAADISFCVTRGKKPQGATEERLFSAPRDGFHTTGTVKGAHVHDSLVEHNGDDGVNFWTFFFRVDAVDKENNQVEMTTILGDVGKNPVFWNPGETVNIYDGKTAVLKGTAVVTAEHGLQIHVDCAEQIEPGDLLNCPDRVAEGAVIEDNVFRNIDGIGMLLKSPGAVARRNHIECMAHAGVWIGCYLGTLEGEYMEGPFPENVLIYDNRIIDTGYGKLGRGDWFQVSSAIHIGHVSASDETRRVNREVKGITIENNMIQGASTYGILVSNAKGVRVANNFLSNTNRDDPLYVPEKLSIHKNAAIVIKSSDNVELLQNIVEKPGEYQQADISVEA